MLALALRQAWRRGATVAVIDPRLVFLPFEFQHLAVSPGGIDSCLNLLSRDALSPVAAEGRLEPEAAQFYRLLTDEYPADPVLKEDLTALGRKLTDCRNPVMVCNTDIVRDTTPGRAADHARLLKAAKGQAGLFYLLPGPNAFAAAMLSPPEAEDLVAALENGSVKALLIVENDPFWSYPHGERLIRALDNLELLVVLDYLPSAAVARAQMFLPTATVFEKEFSHYVNQEGRLQQAAPLYQGGTPIMQVSGGTHPPRTFLEAIPGGEPRPGAEILTALADALTEEEGSPATSDLWGWLSRQHEGFQRLGSLPGVEPAAGGRLLPEAGAVRGFSPEPWTKPVEPPTGQLELLLVDQTFGTEELAGYSAYIQKVEEEPHLLLQADLAADLGLAAGDQVALHLPGGEVAVRLQTARRMAPGVAILPRHRRLDWQKVHGWPTWIGPDHIKKL
jgi:NADH-quinone oxidoreductase subunit G